MTVLTAPTTSTRILVADDNLQNRHLLEAIFRAEGFGVETAEDGETALARVAADPPSVVVLDMRMPGLSGLETLGRLRALVPDIPVLMLTAHGDIDSAVAATKLGAHDFLTRPINDDELVLRVRHALEHRQLRDEVRSLRGRLETEGPLARLLGSSAAMRALVGQIRQVATSGMTTLVLGETGTGKELVARAIHHESGRGAQPFVAIDCGAIPDALLESELFGHERGAFSGADRRREGRFVLAQGGSVFLDEIGNLPLVLQAKLLRVLQEREVQPLGAARPVAIDVRFIAATNESLDAAVEQGEFRRDLYYRLAELTIRIRPLRERTDDVLELARHFVEESNVDLRRQVVRISDEAADLLRSYAWPGNVRELRNVVRQAVLQAPALMIEAEQVRPLLSSPSSKRVDVERSLPVSEPAASSFLKEIAEAAAAAAERQAIVEALRVTQGNKSKAARMLHVDFKTLHLKMRKLGIVAMEASP